MYHDNDEYMSGFWSSLLSIGKTVLTNVGPALIQSRLQSQALRQQAAMQEAQARAAQQATQLPLIPQAQAVVSALSNSTIIRGVPDVVLYGGAALLALALIMRRR